MMGESDGVAEPAVVQQSPQLVGSSPALSPRGRAEYCSTLGGSALEGSMSAGQSALVFAAETPVVPLRQGRGTAGEGIASTPFFTPGVSTASVARQFHQSGVLLRSLSGGSSSSDQEQQDLPPRAQSQSQPQHPQEGCPAKVAVPSSTPLAVPKSCTEVRAPAMVDMSPQRTSSLTAQEKAPSGDAGESLPAHTTIFFLSGKSDTLMYVPCLSCPRDEDATETAGPAVT